MIEKFTKEEIESAWAEPVAGNIQSIYDKINELVDAINAIQKEREAERFEIQEWIGILEAVREFVNIHEKQIDELQMKVEPEKCKPVENTTFSKMENVAESGNFAKNAQDGTLKCPFCQQELVRHWGMEEPALYCCDNPKCSRGGVATESAWQELIRTKELLEIESSEHELCHDAMVKRTEEVNRIRKALDVAVDAMKEMADWYPDVCDKVAETLDEITALEQKDE